MMKQAVPEPIQINFQASIKKLSGIFQRAEKNAKINGAKEGRADGKEDMHFLPMLQEGLAALNITGAKTPAAAGKNLEREQEMNNGAQTLGERNVSEFSVTQKTGGKFGSSPLHLLLLEENSLIETQGPMQDGVIKIDERQIEVTEIPAGLPGAYFLKTESPPPDKEQSDAINNPHGLLPQRSMKIPPYPPLVKGGWGDFHIIVSNALREKGIDEKGINEILAVIKEQGDVVVKGRGTDDLLSDNVDRKIKVMPSDSPAVKGDGRGDAPSFFGNGKVAVPEPLLAALREKGIDEKGINEILAVIKERGDVVVKGKGTDDLLSDNVDRKINIVRHSSSAAREGSVADNNLMGRQAFEKPVSTAAVREGGSKAIPQERQAEEIAFVKDFREGISKAAFSDSHTVKGDGRGDLSSFSGKGKVAVQEPFMFTERTDLAAYGGGSAVTKAGDANVIEGHLLVNQIASQLPHEADKGFGRVRITLSPEHLGSLDMDIIIRENKVQVVLMAERHDVRQVLQSHGDQLRNALQEQGLHVDGIDFLLRGSPQEMDGGSGGSHLWWRENNSSAKRGKEEEDISTSSAIPLLVTRETGGTVEGGISLFV